MGREIRIRNRRNLINQLLGFSNDIPVATVGFK
jgi:hypothetical protein